MWHGCKNAEQMLQDFSINKKLVQIYQSLESLMIVTTEACTVNSRDPTANSPTLLTRDVPMKVNNLASTNFSPV